MSLQTIVSREINPAHPSVVTVGSFEAGKAHNVIAETARLKGTIRAQEPEVRVALEKAIRRVATAVGGLHDARVDVEIIPGTPAVINTDAPTTLAPSRSQSSRA